MKRWSVFLAVIISYLAIVAGVFHEVLFHPLTWVASSWKCDLKLHPFPLETFGMVEMLKGHLPLWNPHLYCGAPFVGNFQSARFYPPNWLFLSLPMPLVFNFQFIFHEVLAGSFMFLWASSRRIHPLASWFAGVLFMFCGPIYLRVFPGHIILFCALVWTPLVFLSLEQILRTGEKKWVLVGIAAFSFQLLAGHPQPFFYCAWLGAVYVLLNLRKDPEWKRHSFLVLLVYLGTLGVTAVQWMTGLAASEECTRGLRLSYDYVASFSLSPESLLKMIFPDLFERYQVFKYGRPENFWETTPYIGTVGSILVLYACWAVPARVRRHLLTMSMIALVLSLGKYTPLFPILYDHMPVLGHLRASARAIVILCVFLCLLAALGLDRLFHQTKETRLRTASTLLGAGIGSSFLGVLLLSITPEQFFRYFIQPLFGGLDGSVTQAQAWAAIDLLMSGMILVGASLLFKFVKVPLQLAAGLVLVALIEMSLFTQGHFDKFEWGRLQAQKNTLGHFLKEKPKTDRIQSDLGDLSEAVDGFDIWGNDGFIPARYCRFLAFSQKVGMDQFARDFINCPRNFTYYPDMFRLLRCKYVLTDQGDHLGVVELRGKPWPRFRLVGQWEKEGEPTKILEKIGDPRFPLDEKVVLESDPEPAPDRPDPRGEVQVIDRSTDELEVTADMRDPGLLVLSENYTEGWKAVALPDSTQRHYNVIPADYILRAVPLAAGKHHFILSYSPVLYRMGAWVSLVSVAIYFFAIFLLAKPWLLGRRGH